jgi:hypothetical protein
MIRIFAVLAAALVLLGGSASLRSQPTEASVYLARIAALMENTNARMRLSNTVFSLNAMNEAFNPELDSSPGARAERFVQLNKFSLHIQQVPTDIYRRTVEAASPDFQKTLTAYDRFTNEFGISQNKALYDDGKAALAVTALAIRVEPSPIFARSACECFFLKWICSKFG